MSQVAARQPAMKPKRQKEVGYVLDHVDLARRLQFVVAERKAHAERKRRHAQTTSAVRKPAQDTSRGESVACTSELHHPSEPQKRLPRSVAVVDAATDLGHGEGGGNAYRHIPLVAAAQFTRTTTVDTLAERSLVHKLSRKAMQFHLDGPNTDRTVTAASTGETAPGEQLKALRRSRSQRDKTRTNRHTFDIHMLSNRRSVGDEVAAYRLSTSSNLFKADSAPIPGLSDILESTKADATEDREVNADEHRVDWTQSDEMANIGIVDKVDRENALGLKKSESIWTLRGKLNLHKSKKGAADGADMPRSPRERFLAHFRR